jgi:RNA polymerase sigma-70 factor (ECF subfamily)
MIFLSRHSRLSDAELVTRVAEGDEGAFGELLKRHQDAVYGFAWRLLKDAQEAEDVAQEVFLRLYRTAGRYRPEASLRTFLLRIAKNLCIDFFRRKRPELMDQMPDISSPETPLGLLEDAIDADRLEKAIADLPVNQRSAILLRHTEQLPYNRIAEIMDLTVGAVESLLVRARRTLREVLKESS